MTDIIQKLKDNLKKDMFSSEKEGVYTFFEQQPKDNINPLEEIKISELPSNLGFCILKPKQLLNVHKHIFQDHFYKSDKDCDFLILHYQNPIINIYLIECKSTLTEAKKEYALSQIKDSYYPIKYIVKRVNDYFEYNLSIESKGLIFYTELPSITKSNDNLETGGLPLPSRTEENFDAQDHNVGGKFPVYSKKVSGSHTIHTFDDFLSYFKTA